MTDEELQARMKDYFKGWKEVDRYMEWERRQRVRQTDTARALQMLDSLFESALWLNRPEPNSGLVEQQALFARAKK